MNETTERRLLPNYMAVTGVAAIIVAIWSVDWRLGLGAAGLYLVFAGYLEQEAQKKDTSDAP